MTSPAMSRPIPMGIYVPPSSPQVHFRPRPTYFPGQPMGTQTFKPPAHKHAHHLHSIPPREKSTRTLILDHLLWAHARTRLQQARAELGMRTKAEFRETTESHADDQDQDSDGEDLLALKFGAQGKERDERAPVEEELEHSQDLPLAHSLRLRADGIEKVLIAMLDQPPEIQPPYADEEAPRTPPAIHGAGEHFFPNGVRLRLALSTLVNDLFARDIPMPLAPTTSNTPSVLTRPSSSQGSPAVISLPPPSMGGRGTRDDELLANGLPVALAPLLPISYFSVDPGRDAGSTSLPSISSFTSDRKDLPDTLPPINQSSSTNASSTDRLRRATGRVLELYNAGADPSTVNSPPSLRCPRHLHHSCSICASIKLPPLPASGTSSAMYSNNASPKPPSGTRGAIILGGGKKTTVPGLAPWKIGAGIGAGLANPGIEGTVLRRRSVSYHTTAHPTARDAGPCAVGGKLADLLPRFIRLSALVAVELGREAREREEDASSKSGKRSGGRSAADGESDDGSNKDEMDVDQEVDKDATKGSPRVGALRKSTVATPYLLSVAYRPTREWYAILAGLLTRAVLEGYLSRGWKGPQSLECLLGVGLGIAGKDSKHATLAKQAAQEDEFEHLDPDDCPPLYDAAKILFPVRCKYPGSPTQQKKDKGAEAEAEYEAELLERLGEFLRVPSLDDHDLSTQFEDLAYKFPTEPIERAVVRFCEAVARWRGQPELESYRKKPTDKPVNYAPSTPSMSIDSLVQSASGTYQAVASLPQQNRAPIERYFIAPPPPPPTPPKRRRSSTSGRGTSKRTHFEEGSSQGGPKSDVPRDWTGPYGI